MVNSLGYQSESPVTLSVVLPTTELNSYLRAAVASALADEPAGVELEVIVVFDGKLPSLPDWLTSDDRVRCFDTGRRRGAGAAINVGILNATGDFIARLDADDLSLQGRFAAQLSLLQEDRELVLVGSRAGLVDASGTDVGVFEVPQTTDIHNQLLRTNPFVHSSIMARKSDLVEVGLYDEACIRMQDYDLILRLAMVGKLVILPETHVMYRVHDQQNSKRLSGFLPLMFRISARRRNLARSQGRSVIFQSWNDFMFACAQLLRYMGVRRPRYLRGRR